MQGCIDRAPLPSYLCFYEKPDSVFWHTHTSPTAFHRWQLRPVGSWTVQSLFDMTTSAMSEWSVLSWMVNQRKLNLKLHLCKSLLNVNHFANNSTMPESALSWILFFPLSLSCGASPAASISTHVACGCRFCTEFTNYFWSHTFQSSSGKNLL